VETKEAIVAARSGFIPLSPIWPIARLIDVRAHDDGGMVGHELDRDGIDTRPLSAAASCMFARIWSNRPRARIDAGTLTAKWIFCLRLRLRAQRKHASVSTASRDCDKGGTVIPLKNAELQRRPVHRHQSV
jgi:hypothetical protein